MNQNTNTTMKFWLCVIFGMMNTLAFSQTEIEVPLRAYFKPEPIKKNKIQSLVVFLDVYGEAIDGIQRNGKILEFEFDSTGNVCYKLSADRPKRNSFLDHAGDQRVEYFKFDDQGELVYWHRENDDEILKLARKYDDQGHLLQSAVAVNDRKISNHQFKWEDGKMTHYSDLREKEERDRVEYVFDDLGRILQTNNEKVRVKYGYEQEGELVKTTKTVLDSDEIFMVYKYVYHQDLRDYYTHYARYNADGGYEIKMDVSYDEFGNSISYRLVNRDSDETPSLGNPSVYYRIENTYDERDLLVARKFYITKSGTTNESLARVERYNYDSEPLLFKFEKGVLYEEYHGW